MSITLNGTTGITSSGDITLNNGNADGAQVTLTSSGYSNWNIDNYSGRFRAYYNATEYFTIDSSGNVGIGTTSPNAKLCVTAVSGASANIRLFNNAQTTNSFEIGQGLSTSSDNVGYIWNNANTAVAFGTNNTERMRIDSSGRVQINLSADTNYQLSIAAKASQGGILANASTAGFASIQGIHSSNSATGYAAYFNNSGSGTGLYISNTAAWVSTSDERLKEDIKDLCTTERLLQLKPRDYLWKSQKTSDDPTKRNFGFIAQEIKEVFPELVGVSPDGMFSVEYTGLIAPLVKAIQEQQAIINDLKARVTALEASNV